MDLPVDLIQILYEYLVGIDVRRVQAITNVKPRESKKIITADEYLHESKLIAEFDIGLGIWVYTDKSATPQIHSGLKADDFNLLGTTPQIPSCLNYNNILGIQFQLDSFNPKYLFENGKYLFPNAYMACVRIVDVAHKDVFYKYRELWEKLNIRELHIDATRVENHEILLSAALPKLEKITVNHESLLRDVGDVKEVTLTGLHSFKALARLPKSVETVYILTSSGYHEIEYIHEISPGIKNLTVEIVEFPEFRHIDKFYDFSNLCETSVEFLTIISEDLGMDQTYIDLGSAKGIKKLIYHSKRESKIFINADNDIEELHLSCANHKSCELLLKKLTKLKTLHIMDTDKSVRKWLQNYPGNIPKSVKELYL